ncbi:MAG: RNA-binding cell elongation regulator Jag/EloR [Cellulosilyticaceae bacterium]
MNFVEKIGRNIDDAITEALIELGATTDEVNVEIIAKGSKGFLGIGAKPAKVRVTIKEQESIEEAFKEPVTQTESEVVFVKSIKREETLPEVEVEVDTEAEKAINFLTAVLKKMNIEATFQTKIEENKIYINIMGEKMGIVIGKRGETLDSLQYLVNIVVNKTGKGYTKVMLDTENYRIRREETLQKVALKYAKKAVQLKKPLVLEPMNPYDRRIIHSVLQNSKTVRTRSEGREPFRKVVVVPYNQVKPNNDYKEKMNNNVKMSNKPVTKQVTASNEQE